VRSGSQVASGLRTAKRWVVDLADQPNPIQSHPDLPEITLRKSLSANERRGHPDPLFSIRRTLIVHSRSSRFSQVPFHTHPLPDLLTVGWFHIYDSLDRSAAGDKRTPGDSWRLAGYSHFTSATPFEFDRPFGPVQGVEHD
jgi:hypothetical protein